MIKKSRSYLALTTALLLGLTACASEPAPPQMRLTDSHFWQRIESSSAIFQRGPKAQQMLNRDISRCVTELRELKRLGSLRHAIPGEFGETARDDSLTEWDTPERDGYIYAEHLEYHDFESCMIAKGWERIEHVPYDVAEEGRENYIEAITGEKYRTNHGERDPFTSRNENKDEYNYSHLNN